MKRLCIVIALVVLASCVVLWTFRRNAEAPLRVPQTAEALLSSLTRLDGRLCRSNSQPFTGFAIDHHQSGTLKSRSMIADGLLHGLSEGWFTNGQKQVTEHFVEGVSHGPRTKWYADGQKHSEAQIVNGHIHGTFRRWHPNGALAEEVQLDNGQPHGPSRAYFDTGYVKRTVIMERGTVLTQQSYKDGELTLSAQ